jgi:hypothetical protein
VLGWSQPSMVFFLSLPALSLRSAWIASRVLSSGFRGSGTSESSRPIRLYGTAESRRP